MRSDFLANTLVHSKREGKGKAVGAGGREREQDSGQVILPSGRSLARVSPSCLVSSSPDRAGRARHRFVVSGLNLFTPSSGHLLSLFTQHPSLQLFINLPFLTFPPKYSLLRG